MGVISLDQALADLTAATRELADERQCDRLALATCLQAITRALTHGWTPETRRQLQSAQRMAAASLGVDHE